MHLLKRGHAGNFLLCKTFSFFVTRTRAHFLAAANFPKHEANLKYRFSNIDDRSWVSVVCLWNFLTECYYQYRNWTIVQRSIWNTMTVWAQLFDTPTLVLQLVQLHQHTLVVDFLLHSWWWSVWQWNQWGLGPDPPPPPPQGYPH